MNPISVRTYTLTSCLGVGLDALRASLAAEHGGLTADPWQDVEVPTWLGRVDLPDTLTVAPQWECRNNRLALLALSQDGFAEHAAEARTRYGAERCAVVIGTSTSSIDRTEAGYRRLDPADRFEPAYRQPLTHNPHSPGAFVAETLGFTGPASTISAACASSAKAFASAARLLRLDLADAVVVGGVDSLCLSVIYGFHSLQLVSAAPCRPFDVDRDGISLGEAAGFALLTREPPAADGLALLGHGESCDAYHMSSAHPEGLGAQLAMQQAVAASGLAFADVDYVNLHGTGTRGNDQTEGLACARLLAPGTRASATKSWTGHTLGAAGVVEALLCLEALASGRVPGTLNTRRPDTMLDLLLASETTHPRVALSNSFGFGGNNCALVFGRT